MVQSNLGAEQDPISKITRAKRPGGVAQVVAHLLSKHNDLSSKLNNAPPVQKKKILAFLVNIGTNGDLIYWALIQKKLSLELNLAY
jgi:hypothetical protein